MKNNLRNINGKEQELREYLLKMVKGEICLGELESTEVREYREERLYLKNWERVAFLFHS